MQTMTNSEGYDVGSYLALAECGILSPDDKIELLEGLIVSMAPASPLHDAVVHHVGELLARKLPAGTLVRTQTTFLAGTKSAVEPDAAVLPGRNSDYLRRHPSKAHLLVEVSDSSLPQDRLTKAAIYARAGISAYWIVNLRDHSVECFTEPDQVGRSYMQVVRATATVRLPLPAFPEIRFEADELFPQDAED